MSRESEERSGMSLKYESYDPNVEIRTSPKVISIDSNNRFGRTNLFNEGTSNELQVTISKQISY